MSKHEIPEDLKTLHYASTRYEKALIDRIASLEAALKEKEQESNNRHERALAYARDCDNLQVQLAEAREQIEALKRNYSTLYDDAIETRAQLAAVTGKVTDAPMSERREGE